MLDLPTPRISNQAYVSSTASIVGDVTIAGKCIILPQVSIRADEGSPFFIAKGTNIQDRVVIHGLLDKFVKVAGKNYSVYIGSHCSIAHGALIHGPAWIDKKCFIGFNATVYYSTIGRNCYIDTGAIVQGVRLKPKSYVPCGAVIDNQDKVDALALIADEHLKFNKEVVDFNKNLCAAHLDYEAGEIIKPATIYLEP